MNILSKRIIFGAALVAATSLALAQPPAEKLNRSPAASVSHLHASVAVSGQVTPEEIPELRERGFTTIISLRPDGEGADQPPSAVMAAAARENGMRFAYVPVAPGGIPDSAVAALDKALADNPGQVLLYCRSGKRAARTWALVEASRTSGMDGRAILAAMRAGGQSADDLGGEIAQRISQRASVVAGQK